MYGKIERMSRLDEFLPEYDVRERHERRLLRGGSVYWLAAAERALR